MKSVVFGGCGFIGSWLTTLLKNSGRDVVVIGTRTCQIASTPKGVRYIFSDRSEPSLVENEISLADEVYDLSYSRQPNLIHGDATSEGLHNLALSVRLFQRLRKAKRAKRILVMSSGGSVYGMTNESPVAEDFRLDPISPYGLSKLTLEKYALMFCRQYDLPILIARPSNAYGGGQRPYMGQGFIATAIAEILNDNAVTIFGECGTVRDYIHVSDLASGILAIMDGGSIGEIYNIGAGIGRNNIEVIEALSSIASARGKEIRIQKAPARPMDPPYNVLDTQKLRGCTSWRPVTSFALGLTNAWEYVERHR